MTAPTAVDERPATARPSLHVDLVTTFGLSQKYRSFPEYQQAAGLVRAGHYVRAYTYAEATGEWGADRREQIAGAEVARMPHHGWWAPTLARAIATGRPDIVHIHHWSNQLAYSAALACRARGIPYVFTPHGLLHDRFLVNDRDRPYEQPLDWSRIVWRLPDAARMALRSRSPRRALRNYLTHRPLANADMIIALSQAGAALYRQMGIPADRLRVIPNGIDLTWANVPEANAWRERWPRPVVAFIGQLKYRKGWDLLLRAIPDVLQRHPSASFVFNTHSPVAQAEFTRLVTELGIGDYVHLLHRISEEEKARLFHAADLLCLPTRYEGFGLPVAEAMAAGLPVVATRLPVIDEMITDGHDGLLAPYDDPAALATTLSDALADAPLRARLAANARQSVQRFAIDHVISQILDVYASVLDRRQRTRS